MLVLSRKLGESIVIGDNVRITIQQIKGSQVRIGIEAPSGVDIMRSELLGLVGSQLCSGSGTATLSRRKPR